ncbi:MAG: DNA cytosine methyltransferase [Fusobacterium necrophorum]|nr:DNA cytosine methyltransferase [Fusobacterium necrophorum]
MKVLSLFDGISCGQIALQNLKIPVTAYYASEIKKTAIFCTKMNFPNTIHIGDVQKVHYKNGMLYTSKGNYQVGKIDLLIGGSPCQDLSRINIYKKGLKGEKSKLFFEFLRLLEEIKPDYFLLENVKMKKDYKNRIDSLLKVKGIEINSNLVSYQNRNRIYWSNIPNITLPKDQKINFQDFRIRNYEIEKKYKAKKTPSRKKMWNDGKNKATTRFFCKNVSNSNKIDTILTKQDHAPNAGLIEFEDFFRYLTREELEMGQTLPAGYTRCLNRLQAENVIGDAWTVKVIEHIFSFLPKKRRMEGKRKIPKKSKEKEERGR